MNHPLADDMVLAMRKAEAAWGHGLKLDFKVEDPSKHRVMLVAALLEAAGAVGDDEPSGHIKISVEDKTNRDFQMNVSIEPPPDVLADKAKHAIAAAAARSLLALLEGDDE